MAAPSKFGKYELIRRIGVGGMAEVFLARTTVAQGLAKELVIKKIHPAFARSRQFVAMFVDEAKIALGLNHPNIVQVFDFGAVGDTYFLAMEFVEGMDLLHLVQESAKAKRPVPISLGAYIMQQVAKGLDYAHRKTDNYGDPLGIVHRDISQQNILVSWDGGVKIVDFGIARARDVQEEEGVIKGKFAYMSPEQARGEPVDCRSDVFSAGVVLFELICGRPLFTGKGKAVLEKVKAGAIARPRYFKPNLPKTLEDVILKALAFHRDDRFQTARDMQHALRRFQFQNAKTEDDLVDSGALAQFVNTVVAADTRKRPRPPAAIAARPRATPPPSITDTPPPSSALDISAAVTPPPKASSEIRERKYVFVLEGQICGLKDAARKGDMSAPKRALTSFVKVAKDIAFKHHAHVDEISHEGFRFVVGLPVASEDDATRSLRLALALVDALDGIGLDMAPAVRLAVGIQRGMAMLTRQGGRKFTYDLAESTTTIARRLAREAQGAEVLVGGRVYRLARSDWNFEEVTSIDVPADPETQPNIPRTEDEGEPGTKRARVYRLRGPKERAERMRALRQPRGKLIGRDLELKELHDAYRDALVSRRKRQILILGDSGVGKRSLVTAFLDSIPKDEAVVLRTAAHVSKAMTPFAIVADLARDLMGLADGAASAEVIKRMERVAMLLYPNETDTREVRGLIQAAGMLLGARADDDAGNDASNIDADERKERIYAAVTRVEERLRSKKPLIVVGEDAHWADDESMELFARLLKIPRSRPILGLVTSRPDPKIYRLAEETNPEVIHLEELDHAHRTELVTRCFAPGENVAELAKQIVSRTGGNPFFIEEMLDALTEKGIVSIEPQDSDHPGLLRWIERDAPIEVPSTVESLIATRLDVLPQAEKETLFHAAIFGRIFNPQSLEQLMGRPIAQPLAQLVRRGLIGARNAQYVFRNDMTMTVAYSLLPEEERTRLHQLVASQIANAKGYRQGQDDAVIARHLELAGEGSAAASRYLQAATHALDVGGNADAFRQLTRALKLLPQSDHVHRFAAREQREQILGRLARRPEQLREIHALRKQAEALADSAKIALAYCRLAQFYIDVGRAPAASRAVTPALQHARDAGDKLGVAEALRLRSSIARLVGNNEESIDLCEQALAMCGDDRAGRLQRGTILNNRGTALWNMGKLGEAIHSYAEALIIYRGLELPRLEARALNNMGIVFAALGEFEEALAHYKSSLKLDQQLGDRDSIALKLGNIGQTYTDLGDVARGERYLTKALKIANEMDDRTSATDCTISLGQVYLQKQDYPRSLELLERGLALATEDRERYQEIRALIYIALTQLELGKPPEGALGLARSATELARKMPMAVGVIYGLAMQGLALAKLGQLTEAAQATAEAVQLQSEQDQPEGAEQILHIHATISDEAGNVDAAREAIAAARKELLSKSTKIRDQGLEQMFLGGKTAQAIAADYTRITGQPFDA